MKQPCPSCKNSLTLADHMAGRPVKCPICGNKFTVPGVAVAPMATTGMDELSLQPVIEKNPQADGPSALEFCPNCGAKWAPEGTSCKKCYFNVAVGRKIRLTHKRWIDLRIDTTKITLFFLAIGAIYGIYWLYHHWTDVKGQVDTAYDRASRGEVSSDSQRGFEKKTTAAAEVKTTAAPRTPGQTVKPVTPVETGPDFQSLPLEQKVKLTLQYLRAPETQAKGKARAVELAANTDAQPLLAKALEEALKIEDNAQFGYRAALTESLATQSNPLLVRPFVLSLSQKGLSAAQAGTMLNIILPALDRAGGFREAEIETALREGPWELKAGVIAACGRGGWKQPLAVVRALLKDPSLPLRRATALALNGDLCTAELIPDLVQLLGDEDIGVALLASQALAPFYRDATAALRTAFEGSADLTLGRSLLFARGLLGARDPKIVELISNKCKNWVAAGAQSPAVAHRGERLLLAKGDTERLAMLGQMSASGKIDPPGLMPYVVLSLADPIAGVRRRAAAALAGSTDPAVQEALAYACLDKDITVSMYAADAPDLKSATEQAKTVWKIGLGIAGHRRLCSAGALHRAGVLEGTVILHTLAADEAAVTTDRAMAMRFLGEALTKDERKLATTLIMAGRLDPISVLQMQSALARTGDDEARKALYNFMRSSFSDVEKTAALHEISMAKDPRGLPALLVLLRGGTLTPVLVEELCLLLGRMPSKETWAGLLEFMSMANDATLAPLAQVLATYKEEAPKALQERLKSDAHPVRAVAVAALILMGTPEQTLAAVQHLKTEKNDWVLGIGLKYLAELKDLPNTLTAAEWEARLSGTPANLGGKWTKIEMSKEGFEYSIPTEMDPKNESGERWPGDPAVVVHRDVNNTTPQHFSYVKDKLLQKTGPDGGKVSVIDLQATGRNPNLPFSGLIWQEGDRVKALYLARSKSGSSPVQIQVDFSCKAAFWEYNKTLLEKILASICLTKTK